MSKDSGELRRELQTLKRKDGEWLFTGLTDFNQIVDFIQARDEQNTQRLAEIACNYMDSQEARSKFMVEVLKNKGKTEV